MSYRAPAKRVRRGAWRLAALIVPFCAACAPATDPDPRTARFLPGDPQADAKASGFLSFLQTVENGWTITVSLSGLNPSEVYRLALNGYPGEEPVNAILAECPLPGKIDSGRRLDTEGYCDFQRITTNDVGNVMEKLTLGLPPAEYRLKFLVKRDGGGGGTDYRVVLKADELTFSILRPAWRPPLLGVGVGVAGIGLGIWLIWRRTKQSHEDPERQPAGDSRVAALDAEQASRVEPVGGSLQWSFRRSTQNGGLWEIGDPSKPNWIPHRLGFSYIAVLLGQPNKKFGVLGLYRQVNPPPYLQQQAANELPPATVSFPGQRKLDDAARQQYERELEAREEKQVRFEAHPDPDLDKADLNQSRIEWLRKELGDPDPEFADRDTEKARSAVAHSLRGAYKSIEQCDPALARHLRRTIRSGVSLSYTPEPSEPVRWRL